MTKSALIKVLVVTALGASFRRCGHGFTDQGSAFPLDYFSESDLKRLHKEPRLSVREVALEELADTVNTDAVDQAAYTAAQAEAEKTAANKKTANPKAADKAPPKDEAGDDKAADQQAGA
ncbi:HI1506-related protein [Bowmanella denitrificans]|uniref:HI1506-related protein n=1 Tax=Bowmanella denitrificans TaxID=366582 RepID=UPI000C9BDFB9|nr:HI1506-related protein [Bowmanella denitrificans]